MAESKLLPAEETEMREQQTSSNAGVASNQYEEKKFDRDFWSKVGELEQSGIPWNEAIDQVRVDRLIAEHKKHVLFVIIYKWPEMKQYKEKPELLPSLEYSITKLTEIILERDTKTYEGYRARDEPFEESKPTLLHLAAAQNYLNVSQCLVSHYPDLITRKTRDKWAALPVEFALKKRQDDTAAYLISLMKYDSVQELFLCKDESKENENSDEINENSKKPLVKFYFGNIISYGMKKTVKAVLDKLVKPSWPYLFDHSIKGESRENMKRVLESVPDDPSSFDFHYNVLETDENGRQPKLKVATEFDEDGEPIDPVERPNKNFNHRSVSCLRRIADSNNKEAIQHPVVRMLVARKWNKFARKWFCFKAVLYLLFLLGLSFALIYGSTRDDPTLYKNSGDRLRAACEIFSIAFLMFHLFDEIGEIAREKQDYFKVWHNYLDMFGIVLTFLVLPLRFAESKSQWTLASLGYIFNVLRLFKFSSVTRITGLYTTTLVKIIYKDITRFMLVFAVIFVGFCGAMFMALKVDDLQDSFSNFASLMLAGFRALVEQQPVEEDYSKFGALTKLILLLYMGMVIVVLLNVLIAQLSYTYSEAKRVAKVQYAADTMRIVTRLEYSRFECWNWRVKHYIPGDWISYEKLATEMLEYDEERHPWETEEDRIDGAREIMRKILKKDKQKEPLEAINEKLTELKSIISPVSK